MKRAVLLALCLTGCQKGDENEIQRLVDEVHLGLDDVEMKLAYFEEDSRRFTRLLEQREQHKNEILKAIRERRPNQCRIVRGPYQCSDLFGRYTVGPPNFGDHEPPDAE